MFGFFCLYFIVFLSTANTQRFPGDQTPMFLFQYIYIKSHLRLHADTLTIKPFSQQTNCHCRKSTGVT